MSALSRRSTSKSHEDIIPRLQNFYDTYYEADGKRKTDDADSLLKIKKEESPITQQKLENLLITLNHDKQYSTKRKYIFTYGAAHYTGFGKIGSNTTYSPALTKKGGKRGKRGKRVYTRKTYKNKK